MTDMSDTTSPDAAIFALGRPSSDQPSTPAPEPLPADGGTDAADLASTIARVQAVARQTPDVRAERVAALRRRIAAGTYRVPDAVLAKALRTFQG
jgi:flagellar biosynthesis anti-sigma factor FlgM